MSTNDKVIQEPGFEPPVNMKEDNNAGALPLSNKDDASPAPSLSSLPNMATATLNPSSTISSAANPTEAVSSLAGGIPGADMNPSSAPKPKPGSGSKEEDEKQDNDTNLVNIAVKPLEMTGQAINAGVSMAVGAPSAALSGGGGGSSPTSMLGGGSSSSPTSMLGGGDPVPGANVTSLMGASSQKEDAKLSNEEKLAANAVGMAAGLPPGAGEQVASVAKQFKPF